MTTYPSLLTVEILLTTTRDLNTVEGRELHNADRERVLRAVDKALAPYTPGQLTGDTHVFDHACVASSSYFSMRCKALPPLDDSYRPGDAWNKRS